MIIRRLKVYTDRRVAFRVAFMFKTKILVLKYKYWF
nr:MAG TPA: hypothetical protein [Caudoviricetes sp.]